MIRRLILCSLTAVLSLAAPAFAQTGGTQPTCAAGDPVVWANTSSKAYHLQGDKYFGNTKHGQYLCKSKADASGYHVAGSGGSKAGGGSPAAGSSAAGSSSAGSASPLPGASPSAKHRHHRASGASGGASPLPGASPSANHHHHPASRASGGASPLPGASPSATHHHHHRKGSASPSPSAT